jgi:ribosomal protein L29
MVKVLTVTELKRRTPEDLQKLSDDLRQQVRVARFEVRSGQLRRHRQLRALKHSIAKVETVRTELKKKSASTTK